MKQSTLRKLYCMHYEDFTALLGPHHLDTYLISKWGKFQSNMAKFLMELDESNFNKFVGWAEA